MHLALNPIASQMRIAPRQLSVLLMSHKRFEANAFGLLLVTSHQTMNRDDTSVTIAMSRLEEVSPVKQTAPGPPGFPDLGY
jgi:hypothetical protein